MALKREGHISLLLWNVYSSGGWATNNKQNKCKIYNILDSDKYSSREGEYAV